MREYITAGLSQLESLEMQRERIRGDARLSTLMARPKKDGRTRSCRKQNKEETSS
jgi:hypothetical protein